MTEQRTPYTATSNPDLPICASDHVQRLNDVLMGTLQTLFDELATAQVELAALRGEVAALRRQGVRQDWRDREQAARYLSCTPRYIDQLAADGRLPKNRLGTKPLYHVDDLDSLVTPVADLAAAS